MPSKSEREAKMDKEKGENKDVAGNGEVSRREVKRSVISVVCLTEQEAK